jgi:hypothetical protein
MIDSFLAIWSSPCRLGGPMRSRLGASGRPPAGTDDPGDALEGILSFPVRWDAVSKASHLTDVTGLSWEVCYHGCSDRFRVVLSDDSLSIVRATPCHEAHASECPVVGAHRWDSM